MTTRPSRRMIPCPAQGAVPRLRGRRASRSLTMISLRPLAKASVAGARRQLTRVRRCRSCAIAGQAKELVVLAPGWPLVRAAGRCRRRRRTRRRTRQRDLARSFRRRSRERLYARTWRAAAVALRRPRSPRLGWYGTRLANGAWAMGSGRGVAHCDSGAFVAGGGRNTTARLTGGSASGAGEALFARGRDVVTVGMGCRHRGYWRRGRILCATTTASNT